MLFVILMYKVPNHGRLLIPQNHTKIFNSYKPIVLEYKKGPFKNYYEAIIHF